MFIKIWIRDQIKIIINAKIYKVAKVIWSN